MRLLTQALLAGLLVAAICRPASAEIVAACSNGDVFLLNDDLSQVAVSHGWTGVAAVAGAANGNIVIATNTSGSGTLYLRNSSLGAITSSSGWGAFSPATVAGLSSGDLLIAESLGSGSSYVHTRSGTDLSQLHDYQYGDAVNSVAGLANGNVLEAASAYSDGRLQLLNSALGYVTQGTGYGSGAASTRVLGLNDGNALVYDGNSWLGLLSGTDLSGLGSSGGWSTPLTAVGQFADGKILLAQNDGRLYVRNEDATLSSVTYANGFGTTLQVAALPNGLMVIPDSGSGGGWLGLVNDQLNIVGSASLGSSVISVAYVNAVPEPSTLALLATGLIGLLAYAWRKRKL